MKLRAYNALKKEKNSATPIDMVKHKDKRVNIPTEELRDFETTVSARAADIEKACRIRMGQEGLCNPDIADALTFVKLSNGMVIPKTMAREASLI